MIGGPSDVAIIGMSAVFPGAVDRDQFWSNVLRGVDAVIEVPPDRWDWRRYYDPDPRAPDKIVSKWGGFVPDVMFDPLDYGMPPASLPSIEPAQLLALEAARKALADSGYEGRPFARDRAAVVLGMGGGAAQLAMGYAFRSYLPMLDAVAPGAGRRALEACRGLLPEWTEDSFPGFLLNVTAGRIANRFNLGGANYTVDAACGSSLAAAALAVRELETGAADLVVLGGVDTVQNPFTYLAFSKVQAFSPRGRCRPFDASADGIVISEGAAAVILKRLADAERDGDRVYAVIKGMGASSDGRARGLTAPVVEGQVRAIERAYARAGVAPSSVGYVEAHGTGTALGDVVEAEALGRVFRADGAAPGRCVVGSVKSMIGHAKCAAGLAGLINASLALYHRIVPPTIGIAAPNPRLDWKDGPFQLCDAARPWPGPRDGQPRRAGVSAFGFGGTNFHAVLEEHRPLEGASRKTTTVVDAPGAAPLPFSASSSPETALAPVAALTEWPAELFVWKAGAPGALIGPLDRLIEALDGGARPALRDLADALTLALPARTSGHGPDALATLAVVASDHEDLRAKLAQARSAIAEGRPAFEAPGGVFFAARADWAGCDGPDDGSKNPGARLAFLFPGQGSQAPGMLRELAVAFPEVAEAFDQFDRVLARSGGLEISPFVFPPPAFDDAARAEARRALAETEVAQPAIGAACVGLFRLLEALGLRPDMVAGHSYGELVALHAAGALGADQLAELSRERGRLMNEAARGASGAMAALLAGPEAARELSREVPEVQIANWNGPRQTVIAGPSAAVARAVERASALGTRARPLAVATAFHTPMVASARSPLARAARGLLQQPPDRPVYSNLDAAPHPSDLAAIAERLGAHLASPVRFGDTIEAMYRDGARVFIEVGPGPALTSMVAAVLHDRPHLALACDAPSAPGLPTFLARVARLVVAGLPVRLERLTAGRARRALDLDRLPMGGFADPVKPSTWVVNGSRARPWNAPEPPRLGAVLPASALPEPASTIVADGTGKTNGQNIGDHKIIANGERTANGRAHPNADRFRASYTQARGPSIVPEDGPRPVARAARSEQAAARSAQHDTWGPSMPNRTPSAASAAPTPVPPSSTDPIMESFQQTMREFLEVQKSVMLAYLNARASNGTSARTEPSNGTNGNGHVANRIATAPRGPRPAPQNQQVLHIDVFWSDRARSRPDAETAVDHGPIGPVAEAPAAADRGPSLAAAEPAQPDTHEGPSTASDRPDRAAIAARLLDIVGERTGYPLETLGLDLDIEADLGIDSIKRVEILGRIRDELPHLKHRPERADDLDALAQARTLGAIIDRMVALGEQPGQSARALPPNETESQGRRSTPISGHAQPALPSREGVTHGGGSRVGPHSVQPTRRLLEVIDAPMPRDRRGLRPGGRVVLTEDGRGAAEGLSARLKAAGVSVECLGGPDRPIEWSSPSSVENALGEIRQNGPIAGIVHLLPIGQSGTGALGETCWSSRVGNAVKGLFLLARATAADLETSARQGGACLLAATALGGRFAIGTPPHSNSNANQNAHANDGPPDGPLDDFFPGHGGTAGLVKTLAREWPLTRCRVVDFDACGPSERIAAHLFDELFADDVWSEVGYCDGRRVRARTVEAPWIAAGASSGPIEMRPGEPLIVSGGARGITALTVAELARAWKPTLLLLGTTPPPDQGPPFDLDLETADWTDESAIKAALHARLRREGRPHGPSAIEAAYRSARRAREVRANLERFRALGAVVDYVQADVRDARATAAALDAWRGRFGDPVGLVHGAGLIKDKWAHQKSVESFDRVLGTKLEGALNLLRHVRPEKLRFTVLFSSIAGRFGNVGQSDYAAANDALNKLAQWLDRRWPGRALALNWGPWSGVGMVSQLEEHLGRRGLGLIAPEMGRSLLLDELRHGRKGDVEVIYSGGLGTLDGPIARSIANGAGPETRREHLGATAERPATEERP